MPVCPKCGHTSTEVGGKCPRDEYYFVPDEALQDAKHDPVIGTLAAEKYVILSLIQEGGMGAVYRALQLPVEREVAFKVLRAELKDSDQGQDRFIREARAVSRLAHPNIITLHDFGFDDRKHPYMVMEYAPGGSLAAWLRNEHVTTDRILHIVSQVLSALMDAHERGIVHRDLKPENMIVMKSGNDPDFIKLLDFGIARMINEGATRSLTREGEVFGTPHYMAPEQAQGASTVGPPADVYAVGIMLYEMLTGKCPFDAPTPLTVLFMHINEPLPEVVPRPGVIVPESLKHVLLMATAKDPQQRYQSAGEMLRDLENTVPRGAGAAALHAIIGEPRPGTIVPGSAPIGQSMPPQRVPQMTPMPSSFDGVAVHDPEPSIETPALSHRRHDPTESMGNEFVESGDDSATRKGLIAAIVILGVFIGGAIVYEAVKRASSETPVVEAPLVAEPPQIPVDRGTEVAVSDGVKNTPEKDAKMNPATNGEVGELPDEVAPEDPKPEDVKVEPKPEPKEVEPAVTPREEPKKVEPKPKKVEPKAKPAEEVKPKEEPKKFEPTKFAPKTDPKTTKDSRMWGK